MGLGDTSIGGSQGLFPETTWGIIARFKTDTKDYEGALELLCKHYWKPVYHYVRLAWAKSNEDAKDLTQAFFLWLFEGQALRRYEENRGSFRTFLKVLLRHFVAEREETLHRLKRGGGVKIIPLEGEAPQDAVAPTAGDPEQAFDQAWMTEVLKRAIERVRETFAARDRQVMFQVFEAYDLVVEDQRPTYADLAAKLNLKESDVRNHLFAVREALRAAIRRELAELTSDDRELQGEWNALFGP